MVADPDILKQIMGKEHESFLHRPVSNEQELHVTFMVHVDPHIWSYHAV